MNYPSDIMHFIRGLDPVTAIVTVLALAISAMIVASIGAITKSFVARRRRVAAAERDARIRIAKVRSLAGTHTRPQAPARAPNGPVKSCNCDEEKGHVCFVCRTAILRDAKWMSQTAATREYGHWKCRIVLEGAPPVD